MKLAALERATCPSPVTTPTKVAESKKSPGTSPPEAGTKDTPEKSKALKPPAAKSLKANGKSSPSSSVPAKKPAKEAPLPAHLEDDEDRCFACI